MSSDDCYDTELTPAMARHRANHVNVAYAPSAELADKALATKAAMLAELGIAVHVCGTTAIS